MKLSQFSHVSELMRTKWRIEGDLALLDDADAQDLRMTGVELFWSGFPEKKSDLLLHADGGARLWANGALPLSPRGRGREAMTYGRVHLASQSHGVEGADVSHSAELVRGDFRTGEQGPLIRPIVPEARLRHDGAPSPQGEKGRHWPLGA